MVDQYPSFHGHDRTLFGPGDPTAAEEHHRQLAGAVVEDAFPSWGLGPGALSGDHYPAGYPYLPSGYGVADTYRG